MTATLTNVGAGRRWLSRAAEDMSRWLANAKERQRVRREMAALSHLPRHLLRNMGLEEYAAVPDATIRHRFL